MFLSVRSKLHLGEESIFPDDEGSILLSRFTFLNDTFSTTVDGQNPAPPRMMIIPLFIGF